MTKSSYLQRLRQRQQLTDLKEQIVFGLTLGWLMTLLGGFHYFFAIGINNVLWQWIFYLGIVLISVSIILPAVIAVLQKPLQAIAQTVGETVLSIMLTLIYFFLILPVGILFRRLQKNTSFYTWKKKLVSEASRWTVLRNQENRMLYEQGTKKRSLMLQLALVISYFFRNGHYLLIPGLVLLLVLGLIMFFIKTSALAPFIYTLF